MFDLVLLSRCDRIIGGWSGFAIQAASISDQDVEHHLDLIPPADVVELTKADIALHGDRYDLTHLSFAWWAAYYGARNELPYEESVDLVTSAIETDPTNPRARLRLAGLGYREGHLGRGDDALVDALATDVATGGSTLESVMLFSLLTVSGYDSADILDDIERGAREGSGPALIYRGALRAQRGDAAGAREDAAAFGSYAADDPRLAGLPDLDRLAAATIDERLRRAGQTGMGRPQLRSS